MATGVSEGAKGQCEYPGLGRCVRLCNTVGRGSDDRGCGLADAAETEGRARNGDADEDERKKWWGRESQEGTLGVPRTAFRSEYTDTK